MVRSLLSVLLFATSFIGFGQDIGIPIITNFSPEEYNAEPQNWQISQGKNGLIYIANNSGLLEYDGVNWKLIEVPKRTTRSVDIFKDGKIYVGMAGDLGYIDHNADGRQQFVSLLEKIPVEFRDFVEVWKTGATNDGVYFKANKYVFFWDGEKMTTWSAPKYFAFSFVNGNDFYVKEDSLGLICFRGKQLIKLPSAEFFKEKEIRSIVKFDSTSLLVSTLKHGMFIYFADGKVKQFKTGADDFINKNLLFAGCRVNKQSIALGTFRGGLVLMSNNGKILRVIDEESGVRENSIRVTFLDREGGLWLGLNNGISRIEVNSPITVFDKRMNIKGSVYQINRHKGILYIGTSVGLNYIDPKKGKINAIENLSDQVRSLYPIGDQQLVGTNTGSYTLKDFKLSFINNSGGSFSFLQSSSKPNRVYVGLRDGLQSIYETENGWRFEKRYPEIKGQIKSLKENKSGDLWILSSLFGVCRFDPNSTSKSVDIFSASENRVPPGDQFEFFSDNRFLLFSNFKFYQHDSVQKKFVSSGIQVTGAPANSKETFSFKKDAKGNWVAWSNSIIGHLNKKSEAEYEWNRQSFLRIRDKAINFVYPDGDSLIWIGSANGLYRIDLAKETKPFNNFETQIRQVSDVDTDSVIYSGIATETQQLEHQFNQLRFQFSSSFFEQSDKTEYQTFLENSDQGWSSWSTSTKKDYTNLWEGSYTFHVRSRNIYHAAGTEATYSFVILPPWYRTKMAYILYAFVFANLFFIGVRTYYNNLKRANKRLENLVQIRTSKINLQKEEIESQRDNLVQAQQTIETQNAELLRMNHELEKIVEERTSELKNSNTELIEVNKELDRFVYRAAHDLRGPVATLLGLCNLSIIETKDQVAIEYLSKIQLTAERLNFLLFMLLKINRIKTQEVRPEPINIGWLVTKINNKALNNHKELGDVKILTNVDPEISLHSDHAMITIILENLIDNALKFAKEGREPQISVNLKKIGDRVKIIVTDNGIGIPEEHRSKIFDMFFIGTSERKGLGLGLYAVQMAAKKIRGTVRLLENNSSLTQFLVDIPERI